MLKKLKLALMTLSSFLILSLPVALSGMVMTGSAYADTGTTCGANTASQCTCLSQGSTLSFGPSTTSGCAADTKDTSSSLDSLVSKILNILSLVVGIVAVIMIIAAGFVYVTSGGKDESVKSAKNMILYAIVGLIVVALAQVIVRFVLQKTVTATS